MSNFKLDFSATQYQGGRIAIVHARFNEPLIEMMIEGAREKLSELSVPNDALETFNVAGAYELPFAAQQAAKSGNFDAIIAIGVVIKGDTPHFDFVSAESSAGLMRVSLDEQIPIIFGILTTNTEAQAEERANPAKMNKGGEAAATAVEMINLKQVLHS
ncbi:6,7-dimethyl-8-ribityllumazine synthase [Kangiella sp. TOML190]|uniref:6,7-dimethyl-8-ribityllumazine synthase n=1 Tax=Kangiella sp. TOML190 TaxID=2931351 RepID=UPI0020401F43|nr:6,7-dimethyl-8-ribityllumazine synthase [Kangiella sp. TOML190]